MKKVFISLIITLLFFVVTGCKSGSSAQAAEADNFIAAADDTAAVQDDFSVTPDIDNSADADLAFDADTSDAGFEDADDILPEAEEDIDIISDIDTASTLPCTKLFGVPNDKTGLTSEQCVPQCDCGGKKFIPPVYSESDIKAIEAMVNVKPFAKLTENPYDNPEKYVPVPGTVCGLHKDTTVQNGYFVETYASSEAAVLDGAVITHYDACGVCSDLKNLAVYMRHPDLTDPVRQCGLNSTIGGETQNIKCLQDLGFDYPCAQIWYYNTKNTQSKCLASCMAALNKPYHNPDGTLNDCMVCDEKSSGEVFKSVAGRNRRNTGLPSSMCRPCSEVLPVYHEYK